MSHVAYKLRRDWMCCGVDGFAKDNLTRVMHIRSGDDSPRHSQPSPAHKCYATVSLRCMAKVMLVVYNA